MADTSTISLRKSGDQTRGVPQFNVVPIDELSAAFIAAASFGCSNNRRP
jgi:hypothetical protein